MRKKVKTVISATAVIALSFSSLSAIEGAGLSSIISGSDDISSSLGSINSAISSINGFNLQSIISNIDTDNEMLGCLVTNVNLSDIANIPNIPNIDGLCGNVMSGNLLNMITNPIGRCVASRNENISNNIQSVTSIRDNFSSFCRGYGQNGSNSWLGSGETGNTGNSPSSRTLSPIATLAGNVEGSSTTGGVKTWGDETPLKDKKYPSGLSVEDIYGGEGGGKIYNKLTTNPDGEDAQAIKTGNKYSLILKEIALKLTGDTNENNLHLPKDKLAVLEDEKDVANFVALGKVDYAEIKNTLIKRAREKYKSLNADSIESYIEAEKKAYKAMLEQDREIKEYLVKVREQAVNSISQKYAMELMRLKESPDYIHNTSYTVERLTKKEYRGEFKAKSFLQMNKETLIKTKEAEEKRIVDMKINQTVQDAYYLSSIFRADIAKKEIDTILRAVDTAIR